MARKRAVPVHAPDLRIRIRLGNGHAVGPGKIDVLEAIAEEGSIVSAARRTQMSYQRAWTLVDELNRAFREPLVELSRGGSTRGGAKITSLGAEIVRLYRAIERDAHAAGAAALATLGSQRRTAPDG